MNCDPMQIQFFIKILKKNSVSKEYESNFYNRFIVCYGLITGNLLGYVNFIFSDALLIVY